MAPEAKTETATVDAAGTDGDRSRVGRLVAEGRRVLRSESDAVSAMADRLDERFAEAVEVLYRVRGRVIVTGVGKSGIVARKLAATLTSTGTPASFLHPVDGLHGDLGIVGRDDAGILISKSGNTSELAGLVEYLIRLGVPILALTGEVESPLARHATVTLDCGVSAEACPLDLAPTSSTTAAVAMGDALAMVLLQRKGFRAEDFARFHPGGALGRKLTLRVEDLMVREDYPEVPQTALMRECIVPLAHMRGTVPIVDDERRVRGVVTAGDLTRLMDARDDFLDVPVARVMTSSPRVCRVGQLAGAVVREMEESGIMALPVVDDEARLQGVIHLHDILRAGLV